MNAHTHTHTHTYTLTQIFNEISNSLRPSQQWRFSHYVIFAGRRVWLGG